LSRCTVAVVPKRVFGAVADAVADQQYIFLFEGLLNLIACQQELSYMLSDLPAVLLDIFPNPDYPTISVLHWTGLLSARLIHGYATRGEPLPDFSGMHVLPRGENVRVGFVSAMWWTLLHELGHHAKGHLVGDMTPIFPTSRADLLVADELRPYQQAELEADAFVLDALVADARRFYLAWMSSAIYPQMMFDSLLTTRKDTHPLSIDRLEAARRRLADDAYIGDDLVTEHLESTASSYVKTERYQEQLLELSNRHLIADADRPNVEAIVTTLATYYEPYGLNLESILEDHGRTWRQNLDAWDR